MFSFNINKNIVFLLAAAIPVFNACRKEKNDIQGRDNFITSFTLKKGSTTFNAAISDSVIIIKAPEGFSLDSATVSLSLSEHASVYPDPATLTQWDEEALFEVKAWNGERKTYKYTVDRTGINVAGSVVLATQADVDAFATQGATEISGSLIIGTIAGKDSITNLAALYKLKKIGYSLIMYPTFSGRQIVGLDNLQSVGNAIQMETVDTLEKVALPALETAGSISIKGTYIGSVALPKLKQVAKFLTIDAPLAGISFPNLIQVGGALTITSDPASGALMQLVSFPALTTAGNIGVLNFRQTTKLDFPVLTKAGDIKLENLTALFNLSCPKLQTATGVITLPVESKLTQISFPALTQAGGLTIAAKTINAVEFPVLKTITGDLSLSAAALDGIKDFTALTTVTGQLFLSELPNFTTVTLPATLKTIGKLTINNYFKASPSTINVKDVAIKELYLQTNRPIQVIGDDVFKGTFTFAPLAASTFPTLQGFAEVDSFSLGDFVVNISNLNVTGIRKINKGFAIPFNTIKTFGMPDLEEVGGDIYINQLSQLTQAAVGFPALKKVAGNFYVQVQSTSVTTLQCAALTNVGGDFTVGTGYGNTSLASVLFPKLVTITGIMKLTGERAPASPNTKLTNLNGFAALTHVRSIEVKGQNVLTSFAGLQQVIPNINAAAFVASGNSYNPTYADLQAGNWTK